MGGGNLNSGVKFLTLLMLFASPAYAGYFELSANGSYFKYNNGVLAGRISETTIRRYGFGIAYRFLSNTAIELSYSNSKNMDEFSQFEDVTGVNRLDINRNTITQNISVDLILDFATKKSRFRPYIRGGGGYTIRQAESAINRVVTATEAVTALAPISEKSQSVTAQAGVGLKYFILDRIALEGAYTIFASELDQPSVLIHHTFSGGLRFVF